MDKTGFLTRLAARALVVAVAAGGGLLIGGVANAAAPATSSAVSFQVTADDKKTTTTLIVAPSGSFPEDLPVTLIATVSPRSAEGKVQFKDGSTDIGEPVPVRKGAAFKITSTLGVGTHPLTAVFTPTDATDHDPSTSSPVSLTVTTSVLAELPFSLDSVLQSVFSGLPGSGVGFNPGRLIESLLDPVFDRLPDPTADLDPGLTFTWDLLRP